MDNELLWNIRDEAIERFNNKHHKDGVLQDMHNEFETILQHIIEDRYPDRQDITIENIMEQVTLFPPTAEIN